MNREWVRINASPDAIEVKPANIYRGVSLRIISPDAAVTLKPEEARQLLLRIAAALEMNAEADVSEDRKTVYVRTDGGIGKLAARHGIDLVVVPDAPRPPQPSPDHQWDDFAKKWVVPGPHTGPAINRSGVGA